MIEILILYVLHKREKTLYGIRKEITELFGFFTEPSIGTIYPALKRLLKEEAISFFERISEGGKKSSYYSMTPKGLICFKQFFFNVQRDNPSLFYTQLQARLATMGLLSPEERKEFLNELSKKTDIYQVDIENKLKDEFLEIDYYQKALLNKNLSEIQALKEYIKNLNIDI